MKPEELLQLYEPLPTKIEIDYERQLWLTRYSPCGKFLVACGYDASVQRWDVSAEEVKPLSPLSGHDGWVQCMAFEPGGEKLFTADSWGRLTAWKYAEATPKPVWDLPEAHDGWIRALSVSADGKWIATAGNDRVVRIYHASDGKLHKELPHPVRIYSLCFHPDGKSLVSGDLEGVIRHWNLADEKETRRFDASILYSHEKIQHCGGVRHLAFNAEAKLLVCSGQKEPGGGFAQGKPYAIVFDWDSGKVVREMEMGGTADGFAYDVQFHPAGFVMAVGCAFPGKGQVWFWHPGDEKAFFTSKDKTMTNGRSFSLHPDGRRLATVHSVSGNYNGRNLKDGEYPGGVAKIRVFEFSGSAVKDEAEAKKS